jgi:predicted N-acetyltransferase YhbS
VREDLRGRGVGQALVRWAIEDAAAAFMIGGGA